MLPFQLLLFREVEVADNVLAFVPLAVLHRDVAKYIVYRRAAIPRAIEYGEQRLVEREAALPVLAQ